MITKWLSSLTLLSATLHGWGNSSYKTPTLQTPPPLPLSDASFPLNTDQEWFVKPSLLVWRPYQGDIDTGFTQTTTSTAPLKDKDKTQSVKFKWGTGVRVTAGKYLPHHELWDVTLATTYFYSDAKKNIKGNNNLSSDLMPNIAGLIVIADGWNPSLLGRSAKTELNWRINYFTWDLALGRLYSLTPKVVLHPFICLRTMLIYEKYSNRNDSLDVNTGGDFFLRHTRFRATNNVWGIGPRVGSDFAFYFGKGWFFQGGLSGAIVMGRYHIHERLNGFILDEAHPPSPSAELKIRDADTVMRANFEGNIGLGWEKWVRKHSVRMAPSFIFEVSNWFLINNWAATNLPIPTTPGVPDWGMNSIRRMGDLGFLGFTVNLQVDF
ncbi:MAG: Lpg1974 family pore-forming outer membrane protein [Rhabdochlamydiaceae bacterium]|jgi:hypothetical protein